MSKLQSLQDITSVLPTPVTGVCLSVSDRDYFNELRDELHEKIVLTGTSVKPFSEHIPYTHIHFMADGIEFLVKLDEK